MIAWYGINIPNRKVVKMKVDPLNFHFANTKPLIDPIIAEMIEDWITKNAVLPIGTFICSQIGPQASKFNLVGGTKAAD
jgi:hypothetical protein